MRYFFIINPGARQRRSARFIPALLGSLEKRKLYFDYQTTAGLEDARLLSLQANRQGYDAVVAIGGDGTVNQVLNGFYDENGRRVSDARMGVIHTGTSPDFCKSYGIPTQAELALETLLRGHTKPISVARIEYLAKDGSSQVGYYACCASIGLGARVASYANSGIRRYLGDGPGTLASILFSLGGFTASDLRVVCDGVEQVIPRNFNTFIGKTPYIASGMKVKTDLGCEDERLYILSLKGIKIQNLPAALQAIYSGKDIPTQDYIGMSYATTISIQSDNHACELEYDGDSQGLLPCRIAIAAHKLELIANEL